jgi:hypothetical protein
MPWNRNDPDPLEARRRQLAEQERLLVEQRKRLTELLQESSESGANVKPAEPPVWRMEEDSLSQRVTDPAPVRKRNLARQRQRDMVLCIIFIVVLLIVLGIVLWVAHVHNTVPINGA